MKKLNTPQPNSLQSIINGPTIAKSNVTSKCPICNSDDGIITYIDDNGNFTAKFCECRDLKIQANRFKFANIPEVFSEVMVNDFKSTLYKNAEAEALAKTAKNVAVRYILDYGEYREAGKGLYFFSNTKGSGKTMLAIAIGNALIKTKNQRVRFITTLDLLAEIKAAFYREKNEGESSSDIINAMKTVDVLILDDIGTEKVTSFVEDTFYQILDTRYVNKLVTIFTSNTHIINLKHGERIISRIDKMAMAFQMPEESVRASIALTENQRMMNKLLGKSEEGQTKTD